MIEFKDLKRQYAALKDEIDGAISDVLKVCDFISGDSVRRLERELERYIGVKHCITCANGTDALSLAAEVLGIGEGDAIFIPDFTFFATGEIVSAVNATPVFVDVDNDTFNISPSALEYSITQVIKQGKLKPKAIIPVDLYGLPADMLRIRQIAEKYNLMVIEDGAQGFGGSTNGLKACSFGDISITSFFPAKPLGCYGDGGALFTDNDEYANTLRSLCVHGKGSDKYDNVRIGRNSRLDTIQAAVLLVKLKAFEETELSKLNKIASYYSENLKGNFILPTIPQGFYSSWAQYTLRFKDKQARDAAKKKLFENQIPSLIYYPKAMRNQTAFNGKGLYFGNGGTDLLCDTVLSIPIHPYLQDSEVFTIINFVNKL